jgi:hypothetical protein
MEEATDVPQLLQVIEDEEIEKKTVPVTIITGFLGSGKVLSFYFKLKAYSISSLIDYFFELCANRETWQENRSYRE